MVLYRSALHDLRQMRRRIRSSLHHSGQLHRLQQPRCLPNLPDNLRNLFLDHASSGRNLGLYLHRQNKCLQQPRHTRPRTIPLRQQLHKYHPFNCLLSLCIHVYILSYPTNMVDSNLI